VDAPNVHNVAIEGTFDDCQDLVKAAFADAELSEALRLSAMNSINWERIAAQIVYYVAAAAELGRYVPVVPTGNFGNILAGWIARRSGARARRQRATSGAAPGAVSRSNKFLPLVTTTAR
jgi:threonine synthase